MNRQEKKEFILVAGLYCLSIVAHSWNVVNYVEKETKNIFLEQGFLRSEKRINQKQKALTLYKKQMEKKRQKE